MAVREDSRPPAPATGNADPFLWLEEMEGARALAWVKSENAKTLGVVQRDPRFAALYVDAYEIASAQDRIPSPSLLHGAVYNFWQDDEHVRGVWRYTSIAGYVQSSPAWTTALDLDALATSEHANWVWKGADCVDPQQDRCMVSLSDGGEDAVTIREFDLTSNRFVADGFVLPRGKQSTAWEGRDALLVAREWSQGEVTVSGYPYVVKRLRRGEPLSAAVEVFRGEGSDGGYGVEPIAFHDAEGHTAILISRPISTFEAETYLLTPNGARKLPVPLKSQPAGLFNGCLFFTLQEDWQAANAEFPRGALVSFDLAAAQAGSEHLAPSLVYAPGPRETLDAVSQTRNRLLLTTYENVRGRAWTYALQPEDGRWRKERLAVPDESSISIEGADPFGNVAYLSATSFLTPPSVWELNAQTGVLRVVKASPARFDASRDVVEQREARSTDGTRIPYFIVHPKGMELDSNNPTLLTAYGGFDLSMTPYYDGILGKLWLERGGVFVLANIRGGGEFGPDWHEAGLTTYRHRIYDDFTAVARDLIERKVTSPRRLGIQGGSNGGLLMGVAFTQHPELWNAVDVQIPLLDMLRFEQIQAGASWTGEFGSVSNPEQRAFLASISPYHNLKEGVRYPEPLIWTTTKDDRVGPQHARKFAAKLAAMHIPYLFYEVTEGGHGAGANLRELALTSTLEMMYLIQKLID